VNQKDIHFYLFDKVVIGYCLLMDVLILVLTRPLGRFYDEFTFYAGMALIAFFIVRLVDPSRSRLSAFVRLLYPAIMFTFFYRETGHLMFLVHTHFFDAQLTALEASLLGANPTLYIDRTLLNPWLTELFSMFYFSYYFMIPIFLLVVFFKRRYDVIANFMAASTLTFFLSYMLFFIYPIEGPRWHFAGEYLHQVTGPVFRPLVEYVIANGAVRGGCMPSTHFGIALVILLYTFRFSRKTAWWLLSAVIGLAIGTVWGRFHYVSDVVVGGLIGAAVTVAVWKLSPLINDIGKSRSSKDVLTRENVS
jgi:membrane-associated phospholipid phosphatase